MDETIGRETDLCFSLSLWYGPYTLPRALGAPLLRTMLQLSNTMTPAGRLLRIQ